MTGKNYKLLVAAMVGSLALAACSAPQTDKQVVTPADLPSVSTSVEASAPVSTFSGEVPPAASPLDKATVGKEGLKGLPGKSSTVKGSRDVASAYRAGANYFYVSAQQTPSTSVAGAYGNFYVPTSYLNTTQGGHTLQEIAVQSADGKQIVEVGISVDQSVNGDTLPHIFTFSWINQIGGCYNGCGWVDYAPNSFDAGAVIPSGDRNTYKSIGIRHFNDAWWVHYNHRWMGYFPDSAWNTTSCTCTFTAAGFVQWFGEVATASSGSVTPCHDMGTGGQGSAGRTGSPMPSSINSMGYYGLPTSAINVTSLVVTNSSKYSGKVEDKRSISLGGPGWNSAGTATGIAGGC